MAYKQSLRYLREYLILFDGHFYEKNIRLIDTFNLTLGGGKSRKIENRYESNLSKMQQDKERSALFY